MKQRRATNTCKPAPVFSCSNRPNLGLNGNEYGLSATGVATWDGQTGRIRARSGITAVAVGTYRAWGTIVVHFHMIMSPTPHQTDDCSQNDSTSFGRALHMCMCRHSYLYIHSGSVVVEAQWPWRSIRGLPFSSQATHHQLAHRVSCLAPIACNLFTRRVSSAHLAQMDIVGGVAQHALAEFPGCATVE